MTKKTTHNSAPEETVNSGDTPVCGVIMPIAKTEGYNDGHWNDVYAILSEVAIDAGFYPNLVSFDDDVGIIHKRIVHNIYSNPIVICDISSRNANVMLELGMRLAFDKPTIIVKDNKTPYSFDIAAIEHLEYPSDLRYQLINEFKIKLKKKIIETYKRSNDDPEFTTFLKHFGTFKVAKLDEREVTGGEYMAAEMRELKELVLNSIAITNKTRPDVKVNLQPSRISSGAETFAYASDSRLPESLNLHTLTMFLKEMGLDVLSINKGITGRALYIDYIPTLSTPSPHEITKRLAEYVQSLEGH